MTVLKYASQLKRPDEMLGPLSENTAAGIEAAELALAEALVDQRTSAVWDWTAHQDAYTQKLRQLIEANAQGKQLAAVPRSSEPGPAVSLLEALQASLASDNGSARPKSPTPAGRRPRSGGVPRSAASAPRRKTASTPSKAKARGRKSRS